MFDADLAAALEQRIAGDDPACRQAETGVHRAARRSAGWPVARKSSVIVRIHLIRLLLSPDATSSLRRPAESRSIVLTLNNHV